MLQLKNQNNLGSEALDQIKRLNYLYDEYIVQRNIIHFFLYGLLHSSKLQGIIFNKLSKHSFDPLSSFG